MAKLHVGVSLYNIYIHANYVYTVIVFCQVNNMLYLQNVASSIFVLEDRCRKGFRNVSGTFTVILKFCCNRLQFFLGSRFWIKVCARTIFDALRRRSPDSSLLAKKSRAQFGMWEEADLDSELTPSLLQLHTCTWTFDLRRIRTPNSRWHIAVCSMKFFNAAGWNDARAWFNGSFTEFKNADNKTVMSLSQICHKANFGCIAFPCFVRYATWGGPWISHIKVALAVGGFSDAQVWSISWPGYPWRLSLPAVLFLSWQDQDRADYEVCLAGSGFAPAFRESTKQKVYCRHILRVVW